MVIIVMGVSGCGKSTVGRALASRLGWPFFDGDDYHPATNVAKMRAGQPLDDADRAGWLNTLRHQVVETGLAGGSRVLACSALKQAYRERLARPGEVVHFVHLRGEPELFRARLEGRRDHYMPASLLDSQFAALEEPRDALTVSADRPLAEIVETIIQRLSIV